MATLHPYLGVSKKEGYHTNRKNEYNRTAVKRYCFNVHLKKDKDIIKWIENNRPFITAVKKLIREQIKREKE